MNFGQALEAIKQGKQAYRLGWNGIAAGKRMRLELYTTWATPRDKCESVAPCIALVTNGVTQPGWLASQQDMLAEDWEIDD